MPVRPLYDSKPDNSEDSEPVGTGRLSLRAGGQPRRGPARPLADPPLAVLPVHPAASASVAHWQAAVPVHRRGDTRADADHHLDDHD